MRQIWAPWRIEYILSPKEEGCFICEAVSQGEGPDTLLLHKGEKCLVIMNRYPYNPGHLMVAPIRHVGDLEELSDEECLEMMSLTKLCLKVLKEEMSPEGFNLGVNLGKVAGAGLETHVHLHVVPRWNGDTNFMPVLADVKVIPEHILSTYEKLYKRLKEVLGGAR